MLQAHEQLQVPSRPSVAISASISIAHSFFALHVSPSSLTELREFDSNEDRNFLIKGMICHSDQDDSTSEDEQENFYVLKVLNTVVSRNTNHVKLISEALLFLSTHLEGVQCPVPQKSVFGTNIVFCRLEGTSKAINPVMNGQVVEECSFKDDEIANGVKLVSESPSDGHDVSAVSLLSFVPGDSMVDVKWTTLLLVDFGAKMAHLHRALKEFTQTNDSLGQIQSKDFIWDIRNAPSVIRQCCHVFDEDKKNLVLKIAERLKTNVLPKLANLETQLIHGDSNPHNILVRPNEEGQHEIEGIIDFSTLHHSHRVIDVACSLAYFMMEFVKRGMNPIQASGHVLSGYQSKFPLSSLEIDMLFPVTTARACFSICISGYRCKYLCPGDEYVAYSANNGWKMIYELNHIPEQQVKDTWRSMIL